MRLDIVADFGAADKALDRLARGLLTMARGGERRDVLPPIVDRAHELADSVFELDASPDGTPWTPVKKPDGEMLEETGAMRASLSAERGPYSANGFTVIVGYSDEKARHHHYGTKHGGPISDNERKPFHPKMQRRGRWENIRASSRFDRASGSFGQAERWHIPPRPLLPLGDIQAPRWASELESTWQTSLESWMQKEMGF